MLNQKQIIRKKILILRQSLPEETVVDLSRKINNRLIQTDIFQEANCIALYYAIDNEVRSSDLINEWSAVKKIVLPVIKGENIHFFSYTGKKNLKRGLYGITEPVSGELVSPESIDLFVVPGVAFDYACNRLGRGKGYYDRYLTGIGKPVVGLCYDFQLIDNLPSEIHDIKMTMVVTESTRIITN